MLPSTPSSHTRNHAYHRAPPENNSPTNPGHGHRRTQSYSVATNNFIRSDLLSSAELSKPEKIRTSFPMQGETLAPTPKAPSSIGDDFLMVSQGSYVEEPGYLRQGWNYFVDCISRTAAWIEGTEAERQKILEDEYVVRNAALISSLKTPLGASIAHNEYIIDLLFNYANRNGNGTAPDRPRLFELIAVGENIARALSNPDNIDANGTLTFTVGSERMVVESNMYTARALCWYMMGAAASQERLRHIAGDFTTSEMTTSGSLIMKDPGNRIYHFLHTCTNAVTRTSTHYPERLGHNDSYNFLGCIPTFGYQKSQRGIEDYRSLLPFPGGALLFDKLKPGADGKPEIFVKFEAAGCPGFIDPQAKGGWLESIGVVAAAVTRNIKHGAHYVGSKSQESAAKSPEILRQEHVHKGVLEPIYKEFNRLLTHFQKAGQFMTSSPSEAKRSGISAMRVVVTDMASISGNPELTELKKSAQQLLSEINAETQRLGRFSDHFNIERRGAEVHISLNPAEVLGAEEAPAPVRDGVVALDDDERFLVGYDSHVHSRLADGLSAKFTVSTGSALSDAAVSVISAKSAPDVKIMAPLNPAASSVNVIAPDDAAAYLDWSDFTLDWSRLFNPSGWLSRLAFWR